MEIQSVLTELKVFNFLTETKSARKLLYGVCKASNFQENSKKNETNPGFESLFPTTYDFEKIFN